jgi:hypothetical protein
VLGVSAGAGAVEAEPAGAAAPDARGALDDAGLGLVAPGSPRPSAKCAGKTIVGAPGSVE